MHGCAGKEGAVDLVVCIRSLGSVSLYCSTARLLLSNPMSWLFSNCVSHLYQMRSTKVIPTFFSIGFRVKCPWFWNVVWDDFGRGVCCCELLHGLHRGLLTTLIVVLAMMECGLVGQCLLLRSYILRSMRASDTTNRPSSKTGNLSRQAKFERQSRLIPNT